MIVGLGVDIVPVATLRQNLHREVYLRKMFTAREIAGGARGAQRLAAMFAVKEAFMKALGSGIRQGVWFTQIEVEDNAPVTTIHTTGHAAALYAQIGSPHIHVSTSQHGEFALALVILEARGDSQEASS